MTHSGSLLRGHARVLIACSLAIAGLLAVAPTAHAATISVPCGNTASLVSAITAANGTTAADTIDVTGAPCAGGFVLTTAAAPSGGNDTGLPIVTRPLTIQGHGATIQRSAAAPNFRILFASGAALELRDLVIASGKLTGANFLGAGVVGLNAPLTLEHVTLFGNQTIAGAGGGLFAFGGSATIDHSALQFNAAASAGGLELLSAPATVRRTLFFENVATNAGHTGSTGAAIVAGGTAAFENDTFSLNAADNGIGGLTVLNNGAAGGTATVDGATFADNGNAIASGAPPGGAILTCAAACGGTGTPVVHLHNSIVTDTDSTAAAVLKPCNSDLGGSIIGDGGNIEWPGSTCPTAAHADPKLAGFAANGGLTGNYRLLPTSPAIDLGTAPCLATDQRDQTRPGGDGCDAGAYETHPPQTTASATSPTNSPQVTFSSDQASSTFECSVDGGPFNPCTSPFSPTGLVDGTHTVDVRASAPDPTSSSNVNNIYTDPSPAHTSFVLDTVPPVVDITQGPPSPTNQKTAKVAFTVDDATATVTCQVDGGTEQPCSSPFTSDELSDGTHTITVRATDPAGNVGSDAVTFEVDTTPPDTTFTSTPPGTVYQNPNKPFVTYKFTSTESPEAFECRFDGSPWQACTSPATVSTAPPLKNGNHTFEVRAHDVAGNVDPTPASHTFNFIRCALGPIFLPGGGVICIS